MKAIIKIFSLILCLSFIVITISSCTKNNVPPRYADEEQGKGDSDIDDPNIPVPPPKGNTRKVLLLSMDGVSGEVFREVKPSVLQDLLSKSKYSYKVVHDYLSTDASSWVTMLTGQWYGSHKVKEFSDISGSSSGAIYSVLEKERPDSNHEFYTCDQGIYNYVKNLTLATRTDSDEDTRDKLIARLKSETSIDLLIGNFKSAKNVGMISGFHVGNSTFVDAVTTISGYISEIVQQVKERDTYEDEEWLIVITSNYGGDELNPEPGFVVMNNSKFSEKEVTQGGFSTIRFSGAASNPIFAALESSDYFNFGHEGKFSIQLQVKYNNSAGWNGIIGKLSHIDKSKVSGWQIFQNSRNYYLRHGQNAQNSASEVNLGYSIRDIIALDNKEWHTISFVVGDIGSLSYGIRGFADGQVSLQTNDLGGLKNWDNDGVFTVGYLPFHTPGDAMPDLYITNVLVFNKRVSDIHMQNHYLIEDITEHPDYNNLVGYWEINEGIGNVLHNLAPNASYETNLILRGPFEWENIENDLPANISVSPAKNGSFGVTNADLVPNILYWMNLPISNADGSNWIKNYSDEFN